MSPQDRVLVAGTPVCAYTGGVGAAHGSAEGLVLAVFAAAATVVLVASLAVRSPAPRRLRHLGVAVAVVTVVTAWGAWRAAPQTDVVTWSLPLVPVALFGLLVTTGVRGVGRAAPARD